MRNIIKALIIPLLTGVVYCLHGKIVFYDGTYVVGKVTKVDEATVYIIPIGLDTAEGVLVGNIDSLKMENGMAPVINSAVKYFYQNGEFLANDDDWMDEYDDFKYDDGANKNLLKLIHPSYYYNPGFFESPDQIEDGFFEISDLIEDIMIYVNGDNLRDGENITTFSVDSVDVNDDGTHNHVCLLYTSDAADE